MPKLDLIWPIGNANRLTRSKRNNTQKSDSAIEQQVVVCETPPWMIRKPDPETPTFSTYSSPPRSVISHRHTEIGCKEQVVYFMQ